MKAIVATDKFNGIAKNGKIPWNCPEDMKFFRKMTIGHSVIMGRKTRKTLKQPLTDRLNIVISSHDGPKNYKEVWVKNIQEAGELCNWDAFVIGGESIYNQFLERGLIDVFIQTIIQEDYKCDQFISIRKYFKQHVLLKNLNKNLPVYAYFNKVEK